MSCESRIIRRQKVWALEILLIFFAKLFVLISSLSSDHEKMMIALLSFCMNSHVHTRLDFEDFYSKFSDWFVDFFLVN